MASCAAVPNEADPAGSQLLKDDAQSNCLPRAVQNLSDNKRLALESLAKELQSSQFRDFHQFAPAALALNRPEIESKILGPNYPGTISGLLQLRELFRTELPESSPAEECDAPTAKNLRIIYHNLVNLINQAHAS
ncbi:hypothetical protein GGI12_003142 [Dipsacomyces acuminosporus]|nr:hypothetical protein GGI12_003142 [Dipsacomyces acuminosporus]